MTIITDAMLRHYNQLSARAESDTLQDCIARAEAAEAKLDATETQVIRLALENEQLRNKLNTDSQMFTIECLRTQVTTLQIELNNCRDMAYERNQGEDL